MTPPSARTQTFYSLPRTHKETLKIRPIVSGRGGIFDRLGWLLQFILKPIIRHVKAHVCNTPELLEHVNKPSIAERKGKIPVSFDVVSLYTNIPVEEAVDTTLQYINKYNIDLHNLETIHIFQLLSLLLENNVFQYPGFGCYKQIRGLAMGSRLSGTLAILAMDRFEHIYIYRNLKPEPLVYVRYVDDTGTIVNDDNEARQMLRYSNKQHPTIKFELELLDESGFLPILDIKI